MEQYQQFTGFSTELYMRELREKSEIKKLGKIAGLCVIAYVVIQNVLALPLIIEPLNKLYNENGIFTYAVIIVFSILGLLIPFMLGGLYTGKKTGVDPFPLNKSEEPVLGVLVISFGFFICLVANYVSGFYIAAMEGIGIKLTTPEYDLPADAFGRIIYTLSVAIVPPLTEEVAMRGAVLQPLRKYGDKFAIVASSFLFAVLHGNLIQAPFAFICGIGLGYTACITGSIIPGMVVHCLNNLYSVVVQIISEDVASSVTANKIYFIITAILYTVSIVGSVAFFLLKGKIGLKKRFTAVSTAGKFKSYLLNIPMIIAILFMLWVTKNYVARV